MKQYDKIAIFTPLFLSICLYSFVLTSVFYYLKTDYKKAVRYSSKKDNFLDITMVSREKKEVLMTKEIKKKEVKQEQKKEEVKTALKPSENLKDLFGKIKDINTSKPIPTNKNKQAKQSRLKPSKKNKPKQVKSASKLTDSISFEDSPKMSSSVGVYDKFRGEVQEILDGFWNETIQTESGAEAEVKINIDQYGNFSYYIVKFSYNNDFNKKLRDFLEQMRGVKFPKNTDNTSDIVIKFADRLERE